jgi:hypothetical protein
MKEFRAALVLLALAALPSMAAAVDRRSPNLDHVSQFTFVASRAEPVEYRGKHAVRLMPRVGHEADDDSILAVIPGTDFRNGTIELDVSGAPVSAVPNARGFIGVAFHVRARPDSFECFYVRTTNARCDDQLRRNHSVQYVSSPDYPWQRLRQETPGVYESYADMEPGVWIHLKVEVEGIKARLYVNGATQPALIVNDLKLGDTHGAVALWSHTFTDGYFANLRVQESAEAH